LEYFKQKAKGKEAMPLCLKRQAATALARLNGKLIINTLQKKQQ